jgi:hypothetical protein
VLVGICNRDIDRVAGLGGVVRLAQHDQAVARPQLGVVDHALIVTVDRLLLEPEDLCQPFKSSVGVAVADGRKMF